MSNDVVPCEGLKCVQVLKEQDKLKSLTFDQKLKLINSPKPTPNLCLTQKTSSHTRNFNRSIYKIDWIVGCSHTNRLYCWYCIFFSHYISPWTTYGYKDLNNLPGALKKHQKSENHLNSVISFYNFGKKPIETLGYRQLFFESSNHDTRVDHNHSNFQSVKMYKIEVDPKLFITCRLCLDEMGQYQIVPSVQEQIKYCFDFEVKSFDGLPQLICKKCEGILTKFYEIKKSFQEKQHGLNSKIKICDVVSTSSQQQDTVSSTQSPAPEAEVSEKKSFKLTLKKKPGTSDSAPHENDTFVITNPLKIKDIQLDWRKDYNKFFACKFCSNVYKNKRSSFAHQQKHKAMLDKYTPLLKYCKISIPKIDEKPNITGMDDMVMIEDGKILQNSDHQYNVYYKRKTIHDNEKKFYSDSSDEDIIGNRKGKRIRLMSQSSNESLVLDISKNDVKNDTEITSSSKNKFDDNIIECVDIDSSSESDSGNPTTKLKSDCNSNKKRIVDQIVTSCYNKFIRKDDISEKYDNSKESQLQHKILSIGRKVINKKRFNCTGILRYMESKNLNVKWNPKTGKDMESDYVHIRTKLLENKKDDSDIGWKNLSDFKKGDDNENYNELLEMVLSCPEAFAIVGNHDMNEPPSDQAECTLTSNEPNFQLKLLNPNPVTNPKQLPKFRNREKTFISLDGSSGIKLIASPLNNTENIEEPFHMPVITNTVSLANLGDENIGGTESKSVDETSKEVETTPAFVSRIKVKPVSQLMPDKTKTPPVATVQNKTWNVPVNRNNSQPPEYGNTSKNEHNEWVLMHTVELPNTKTTSPFKYFQSLLQIHNIVLLDTKATISSDFSCLIKFKSVFKQESKRITLCLSLFSDINRFYIQVTDTSSSIDLMTLTPTWQWEILQLYRSDIVNNVLDNAKKISQKMYDSTQYFMSVLKSIVFNRHCK